MKYLSIVFTLIFLSSFKINIINSYYILPLKTYYDYDPEKTKETTEIMHNYLTNNIYTELSIAEPVQKLATFIKSKDYCSYIGSNLCNIEDSDYDSNNSKSFEKLTPYNLTFKEFSNTCLAKEKMKFSKNMNNYLSDLEEVNLTQFYHAPNNEHSSEHLNTCGVFGFKYKYDENIEGEDKCINLINGINNNNNLIFQKNLEHSVFSIKYSKKDSKIDGELIIGNYPHEYEKQKYNKDKYKEVKLEHSSDSLLNNNDFHTNFYEVYYFKNNKIGDEDEIVKITNQDDDLSTIFILEQNMFMVPNIFFSYYLHDFFNPYIDNETCNIVPIDVSKYDTIICNKSAVGETFLKTFPTVYFKHIEFNTSFEFTKDELLKEKDGLLYFMMYTDITNEEQYWGFGKIFLEKYLINFDYGNKSIGYYSGTQEDNDTDDDKKAEFDFIENGIYVIIILSINILVVFSCLLYAIINKCTKSKIDPTIMIESFSNRNNEDLKTNSEENVIKEIK